MAVEGTCGRVTKFNAKLFQLICIVTSAAVAGLGAWLYWWGSSFFGLGIIQLTIGIRIIGLALLVIGVAVLAITLVQCAVTACESRICSLTYSFVVFVAVILQVALLAYIYANKGNIEKYAASIWSQLTDQSKVDFQKKDNSTSFQGCSFSTLCKAFMLEAMASKIDILLIVVAVFVGFQVLSLFASILLTSCYAPSRSPAAAEGAAANYPK